MNPIDQLRNFYRGKTVLVTGHTGFKGSWLSLWLKSFGAQVHGYSLLAPTTPSHYALIELSELIEETIADVCDLASLQECIKRVRPDVAFHLAAEPLVLSSYENPVRTFSVNTLGVVHFLEALRGSSVQASIIATTDKVYENKGWCWGYREEDSLGAGDPYSTSKAMAELAVESYRKSFSPFPSVATVRAGNVYGGGDFAKDRLIPDCMRAFLSKTPVSLRNPGAVRPWMYVLDALYGYLLLGEKLYNSSSYEGSWNFAPQEKRGICCEEVARLCAKALGKGSIEIDSLEKKKQEMPSLKLCYEKALEKLFWQPAYSLEKGIFTTVQWYKAWSEEKGDDFQSLAFSFLKEYEKSLQKELLFSGV